MHVTIRSKRKTSHFLRDFILCRLFESPIYFAPVFRCRSSEWEYSPWPRIARVLALLYAQRKKNGIVFGGGAVHDYIEACHIRRKYIFQLLYDASNKIFRWPDCKSVLILMCKLLLKNESNF